MQERVIFLDTMIFLHYQPVEQIPWRKLFDTNRVVLAVSQAVLRELDEKKDHGAARLRSRAQSALRTIHDGTHGKDPREGVSIVFTARAPEIDYSKYGLDPARNDDLLLASVLDYKQRHPEAQVTLVSHDYTPRLKAEPLGIDVGELPKKYALPAEPDPLEVELRDARERLAAYEAAAPKLDLTFAGGDKHQEFHVAQWTDPTEEWLQQQVERLRLEYPKHSSPEQPQVGPKGLDLSALTAMNIVSGAEIERYNQALDSFYEKYETYLRDNEHQALARDRSFDLGLQLSNDGSLPAEDITIALHLPDGFNVGDAPPELPEPPKPPSGPRTEMQKLAASFRTPSLGSIVPQLATPTMPGNVSRPKIRETNSYDVELHVQSLKHGFTQRLPPIWITFGPEREPKPFTIDCMLIAGNIPGIQETELHAVVKTEDRTGSGA